jgi:polyisoprenyl-phosphate glycosyltransferase
MISIVVPVYKGRDSLPELYARLKSTLEKITDSFEIILVNDNCPQQSWEVIETLAQADHRVKGINFSRNFGQHSAITAGLEHCGGEWTVVMDCDLQDRPEEIPALYEAAVKGKFELVFARRIERQDNFFKRLSSTLFYKTLSYLTGTRQDNSIANFGIYHRKVIKAILSMEDYIRYFPTMAQWVGFRSTAVDVEHSERKHGTTSYSWMKLIRLAISIIISFSDKPLRLTVRLGFFISLLSVAGACYTLYRYFAGKIIVTGYTSLIISIWFLCGLIIMTLGVMGLYIGKSFDKVKGRPVYIVRETVNLPEEP